MTGLSLPSLQNGTQETDTKKISSYLYQLTEQLRYLLSNIESENLSEPLQKSLAATQAHAQKALETCDTLSQNTAQNGMEIQKTHSALSDAIIRNASEITQSFDTKLGQTVSTVYSSVSQDYTAKSETAALSQLLSSFMEQTAQDISMRFSDATEYTVEVNGTLQSFIEEIRTYIRFSGEGITLGETGSPFLAKISGTRLSFQQNGVEIAYISNNRLYITEAQITNKASFGSDALGFFFDIKVDHNGFTILRRE